MARVPHEDNRKHGRRGGSERIAVRLNAEQKERIEYAASLKGASTSDFIVSSADEAAKRAIQEHQTWTLSAQDSAEFVKALLSPPAPNERMKAAAQRYRERRRT